MTVCVFCYVTASISTFFCHLCSSTTLLLPFLFFCCCPAKRKQKNKKEDEERTLPSPILFWPGALRAAQIMKGENTICILEHVCAAREERGEEKEEMGGKRGVRRRGWRVVRVAA